MTTYCSIDGDKRREYVSITDPVFSPLFSTIITTRYLIRQTIIGTIYWNDCDIVRFTYTMSISCSRSCNVTAFIFYQFTRVPTTPALVCRS